ncbi:hypothetical protein FA13DRAFT_1729854 [Coprinellus micaceus]|uniref:Uncharacterized protein n=1 Tax=Coprinellus micaceus TaxID=71717 RepID=A0A4Y7TJH2_COPMI|nr:hypothetical protein FA13DRAFT_1729854 [Coprinellus micaceus]
MELLELGKLRDNALITVAGCFGIPQQAGRMVLWPSSSTNWVLIVSNIRATKDRTQLPTQDIGERQLGPSTSVETNELMPCLHQKTTLVVQRCRQRKKEQRTAHQKTPTLSFIACRLRCKGDVSEMTRSFGLRGNMEYLRLPLFLPCDCST